MELENVTADASAERYECDKLHFDQLEKLDDVEALFNTALRLLHAGALKNHGGAQFVLGKCYKQGEGVEENRLTAISLFKMAADNGVKNASNTMRRLYLDEVMLAVCL